MLRGGALPLGLGPTSPPAGVTRAQVLAAVAKALEDCSGPQPARTAGCPEPFQAGAATWWQAHGDPGANAQVRLSGSQADVNGRFVFVRTDGGRVRQVDAHAYDAAVQWTGSALRVDSVRRVASGPLVPEPGQPGVDVEAEVRDQAVSSVRACQSTFVASGVEPCPPDLVQTCGPADTTRWTANGDPGAGARVAYDSATGLFTVTGTASFTETVTSGQAPCAPQRTQQETLQYELTVSWERSQFPDAFQGRYR